MSLHPPLFPQLLLLSMMLYGMEHVFGYTGSAVLAGSPPSLLPTPSLLEVEGSFSEKVWTLQALLGNSQNTGVILLVCYQPYLATNAKHSTTLAARSSIPARPSTMEHQVIGY